MYLFGAVFVNNVVLLKLVVGEVFWIMDLDGFGRWRLGKLSVRKSWLAEINVQESGRDARMVMYYLNTVTSSKVEKLRARLEAFECVDSFERGIYRADALRRSPSAAADAHEWAD